MGGGGGYQSAGSIGLAARNLESFHLKSPKSLTSLLRLLDTLWRNFRQIDLPGGCCSHFSNTEVMKNEGMNIFIFV